MYQKSRIYNLDNMLGEDPIFQIIHQHPVSFFLIKNDAILEWMGVVMGHET